MNHPESSPRSWSLVASAAVILWSGCAGTPASQPDPTSNLGAGGSAAAGSGSVDARSAGGTPGAAGAGTAGSVSTASGAPGGAGAPAAAGASTSAAGQAAGGGAPATSGVAGSTQVASAGAAGSGLSSAGAAGGVFVDPSCKVSTPVSFKKDVEPYLSSSCGKSGGSGCHVTDNSSTLNSACPDGTMKCGFDHAYDWITAGSHTQCNKTPTPIRYTVVLDVVRAAKPASCSGSRIMPPAGPPPSACQISALAAWLAEPKLVQTHRADDTSPAAPYEMPPYN
jgi:hypothetical protein